MPKYTAVVLRAMCRAVKASYKKIDFKKPDWFHEFSWTVEKENNFIKWLTNYLMGTKEARKEMMRFPSKDPKNVKRTAEEFVFNYGWKLKD